MIIAAPTPLRSPRVAHQGHVHRKVTSVPQRWPGSVLGVRGRRGREPDGCTTGNTGRQTVTDGGVRAGSEIPAVRGGRGRHPSWCRVRPTSSTKPDER